MAFGVRPSNKMRCETWPWVGKVRRRVEPDRASPRYVTVANHAREVARACENVIIKPLHSHRRP